MSPQTTSTLPAVSLFSNCGAGDIGYAKAAFEAGATLSHHHGSGTLKNEWIRREKGPWIPIFEKVKRGFDPENRLNPDKMGL